MDNDSRAGRIASLGGDRRSSERPADPRRAGAVVRQFAARAHTHPDGSDGGTRGTIDRWIRAWRRAAWRRWAGAAG